MRYQPDDMETGNSLFRNRDLREGSGLTTEDFFSRMNDGLRTVVYLPAHKREHAYLEDCEPGRVTSVNDTYVFVQFWDQKAGCYKEGSQACKPYDLWFRI